MGICFSNEKRTIQKVRINKIDFSLNFNDSDEVLILSHDVCIRNMIITEPGVYKCTSIGVTKYNFEDFFEKKISKVVILPFMKVYKNKLSLKFEDTFELFLRKDEVYIMIDKKSEGYTELIVPIRKPGRYIH